MKPAGIKLLHAHRIVKRLSGGRVAIYWYRCRGGPQLMRFEGDTLGAALRAEREGAVALAAAYSSNPRKVSDMPATLADIVVQFKDARDGMRRLAASTRSQWSRWLDEIVAEFGTMPVKALRARGVRAEFKRWRDKRADTPRTADYGMQVLKRLLSWALDEELIETNPTEGIGMIYSANRADVIVEEAELKAILAHCTRYAGWVIRLAAATGIRRGDLVRLRWDDVSETTISFLTSKSNGRRRATVPLLPDAKAVIAEIRVERQKQIDAGRVPSAFLLVSHLGKPWKPDGVTQAFLRAAKKVGVKKHLHDLRGTAATRFAVEGRATNEEIADFLGWEPAGVASIRKRYVDANRIGEEFAARLERRLQNG